jgi:hypothetical protein
MTALPSRKLLQDMIDYAESGKVAEPWMVAQMRWLQDELDRILNYASDYEDCATIDTLLARITDLNHRRCEAEGQLMVMRVLHGNP